MHDRKLVSDNEVESAEARGRTAAIAADPAGRTTARANVWTIVAFCIAGMICSLFVPASYLRGEQSPAMFVEAPLS
jgi:hypothetical protein